MKSYDEKPCLFCEEVTHHEKHYKFFNKMVTKCDKCDKCDLVYAYWEDEYSKVKMLDDIRKKELLEQVKKEVKQEKMKSKYPDTPTVPCVDINDHYLNSTNKCNFD